MTSNFFVISAFNCDLNWLRDYTFPFVVYDKTWNGATWDSFNLPPSNLKQKYSDFRIIPSRVEGYNIYCYMKYICDNYSNLPSYIGFIKGNLIGRHVTKSYFDSNMNNKFFFGFDDLSMHDLSFAKPRKFTWLPDRSYIAISSDGGFLERNNSWFLRTSRHPTKYHNSYDSLMSYLFTNYVHTPFIRFSPGANMIVPRENILRYKPSLYKYLAKIVSHHQLSGESHILERALWSIWNTNFHSSKFFS